MNYVYPAVFYEEEGKISVIFPDLGNLATFGDNLAGAMRMAGDVCGLYLSQRAVFTLADQQFRRS